MTLTHILPSLRRTLPDPLVRDHWPAFTVTSPTDVTIAGLSLVRLVDWCATPAVHTGDAVIPGSGGRPSDTRLASVIVVRVKSLAVSGKQLSVWVDAELGNCIPLTEDARLIGRASTAHTADALIFSTTPHSPVHRGSALPLDLVEGDLIAIPCVGATTLRAIRAGVAGVATTGDAAPAFAAVADVGVAAAVDAAVAGPEALRCAK